MDTILTINTSPISEKDIAEEKLSLGLAYFYGCKHKPDKAKAFQLFNEASNYNEDASFWKAKCLLNGIGTEKNIEEALTILNKLSKNNRNAIYLLADYYRNIDDVENAFKFYKIASDKSHITAKANLAKCIFRGIGTNINFEEALKLMEEAVGDGAYAFAEELQNIKSTIKLKKAKAKELLKVNKEAIKTFVKSQKANATSKEEKQLWDFRLKAGLEFIKDHSLNDTLDYISKLNQI